MDHPVREIPGIVRSLCQDPPDKQQQTVDRYFTADAAFIHPFVWVPRFERLPVLGSLLAWLNSRWLLLCIYRWYRIMSPHIDMHVESAAFDQRNSLLYLTIRQRFAVWFIPFYAANVRLVTVLTLQPQRVVSPSSTAAVAGDERNPSNSPSPSPAGPASYADVTDHGTDAIIEAQQHNNNDKAATNQDTSAANAPRTRYLIACQEDHYQVNEFLKFLMPGLGGALWSVWQLFSTAMCVVLAVILGPVAMLGNAFVGSKTKTA